MLTAYAAVLGLAATPAASLSLVVEITSPQDSLVHLRASEAHGQGDNHEPGCRTWVGGRDRIPPHRDMDRQRPRIRPVHR